MTAATEFFAVLTVAFPKIKSLFHKHTIKYAKNVWDFMVLYNLQVKRKLHLGIQTLITTRSLEGIIINYVSSYTPRRGNSFGSGPISVNYCIQKL